MRSKSDVARSVMGDRLWKARSGVKDSQSVPIVCQGSMKEMDTSQLWICPKYYWRK
jgi:hypothetical protein